MAIEIVDVLPWCYLHKSRKRFVYLPTYLGTRLYNADASSPAFPVRLWDVQGRQIVRGAKAQLRDDEPFAKMGIRLCASWR